MKPRRVRAVAMTIQYGVRGMILAVQSEVFKQENVLAERLHGFRFGKKGKLAPRYIGLLRIHERFSPVSLSFRDYLSIEWKHDNFSCVKSKKKCLADASLHVSLDEIKVDKTLRFVEEPVENSDREVKRLKCSRMVVVKEKLLAVRYLVKVGWNSKCNFELTWVWEDYLKDKYPRLIVFVLVFVEAAKHQHRDFCSRQDESRRDYGWFDNADSVVISVVNYLSVRDLGRFMNYLEEATDGEAMINSIQNGDHPLPVVAQVSLAGTAPNAPPTLKDPKFWTAEEKKNRKIDRLARSLFYSWGFQ
ncbi:hypothetical protein Tco_1314834 [Tanacetum coccineum]